MKKLYYILGLISISVFSCNPLTETEKELDEMVPDPSGVQVFSITLADEDYEWLDDEYGIGGFGNFESVEEAREYIPLLLDYLYPQLEDGSAITVNYNLYRGSTSSEVYTYTNADSYALSADDYMSVDEQVGEAGFFNEQFEAGEYIPGILSSELENPEDGELVAVSYEYAGINYDEISGVEIFAEDFDGISDLSTYQTISVSGAQEWHLYSSSSGYNAARMSGYSGGNVPNIDWFILPEIDLTEHNSAALKLSHVLNFLGDGVIGEDIAVYISTTYDGGDPASNEWDLLELDQWPSGGDYDIVESEMSLADYAGETVHIAFYYRSTNDFAPQWRLVNILVEEGESIETTTRNVFYQYDESDAQWEMVDQSEVYYLSSADYEAMGAPGQYDNFSSSVPADSYIPQFLEMKFPYAQEEDEVIVIYKYFSGGVQTRGQLYTFLNGEWMPYESEVEQTLQFSNEDGVWVPDNTIRYTLTPMDYDAIADNTSLANENARSNLATYGNFNTNGGYWTTEDIIDAIGYILHQNFPESEVGQKYLVEYDTYPAGLLQVRLILTEDGDYERVE